LIHLIAPRDQRVHLLASNASLPQPAPEPPRPPVGNSPPPLGVHHHPPVLNLTPVRPLAGNLPNTCTCLPQVTSRTPGDIPVEVTCALQ
jgi:hypothetical protein